MGDHGEVSEVSLNGWIQKRTGVGVAERRPVLVQKIHQLLANHPGKGNRMLVENHVSECKFFQINKPGYYRDRSKKVEI